MKVAIHQPNFFPWLGYFKKIQQADVFVFLDAVEYSKGSWTNRVKLKIAGQARWATCPIHREHSKQLICDIPIADRNRWREKLARTLEFNYTTPYYASLRSWLESLVNLREKSLARYNGLNIEAICSRLGLECRFVWQSELGDSAIESRGSAQLVEICQLLDANCYLAGGGATRYEDKSLYKEAGIEYQTLAFQHPVYPQVGNGPFLPGLSILDALLNVGIEGTRMLL
jgi:hypothetical protein